MSPTIDPNVFTVEVVPLIEKILKKKSEPIIPQNDLTEGNDFRENEVVTPKLNDTEEREVNPKGNNSLIKSKY